MSEVRRIAISDKDGNNALLSVVQSVDDPTKNGIVLLNPDGSTISGGGGGITSINTLTEVAQTLAVGTGGTDFNIDSTTATHTFNLPTASAANRGALSSADWSTFNAKLGSGLKGDWIFVGNVSNIATAVAMSGDVGIVSTGATTIANDAITTAKILNSNVTYAKLESDVQDSLDLADTAIQATSTNTLTNKRITKRITTETSSATPTINTDNCDVHKITALATNITSMTTNLSGTPTDSQVLAIWFNPSGGPYTINRGSGFESSLVDLFTDITGPVIAIFIRNTFTNKRMILDYK